MAWWAPWEDIGYLVLLGLAGPEVGYPWHEVFLIYQRALGELSPLFFLSAKVRTFLGLAKLKSVNSFVLVVVE